MFLFLLFLVFSGATNLRNFVSELQSVALDAFRNKLIYIDNATSGIPDFGPIFEDEITRKALLCAKDGKMHFKSVWSLDPAQIFETIPIGEWARAIRTKYSYHQDIMQRMHSLWRHAMLKALRNWNLISDLHLIAWELEDRVVICGNWDTQGRECHEQKGSYKDFT